MEIEFCKVTIDNVFMNESFSINANRVTCFIGDDDKSILAKVFAGLKTINNGKILIENEEINIRGVSHNLHNKIGVLFDDINYYKKFKTVKKQLEKGLEFYNVNCNKQKRMIEILNMVGLNEEYLYKKIKNLSFGEKKKVYLASIIIYNPEIIILDNFERHFNYKDQINLKKLLKNLQKEYNKTIICISNNAQFILDFVDDLYILNNKRISYYNKSFLQDKNISKYLDIAPITKFCNLINDEIHPFIYYNSLNELIKAVYRDVQ